MSYNYVNQILKKNGKSLLLLGQTVDGKTFNGMTPLKVLIMSGTILKRMKHFTHTMKDSLLGSRRDND